MALLDMLLLSNIWDLIVISKIRSFNEILNDFM